MVEQSSFPLIALFWLKIGRCRGRNWLNGPYSIPIFLLKILSEHIAAPLWDIINDSFSNGIFPDMMKLAKVIPLYKKNSPEDPSNYRPISLLSVFSKITEKLMHTRLYNFLEQHNVLYSLQFGFHDYFTPSSERHTYNTRLASRGDLFLERRNTFQYGIRSIEYNGARLWNWNMLPVTLRESSSPPVFRSDLKKYLLHMYTS